MIGAFDAILLNIMIDMEVQEGSSDQVIIKHVQNKYKELPTNYAKYCIANRRKEWAKTLLENYYSLSSWGAYVCDWEFWGEPNHQYKIYRDVPSGFFLKMMLEEALEAYGEREPEIRALLVLRYIEPNGVSIEEIKQLFHISNNTIYNWLDKGILDIGKIMAKEDASFKKAM